MSRPARSDGGGGGSLRGEKGAAAPAGGGTRPSGEAAPDDETPGVPGFRTWRGVYWFVFGCFGVIVVALSVFARVFA